MISVADIKGMLEQLKDPEIPVLSLGDLGIIRDVEAQDDIFNIIITPTYNGCPAMKMIEMDIRTLLDDRDIKYSLTTQISPAWTTEWMTETGKNKLIKYGISPPSTPGQLIKCPRCKSNQTKLISEIGSTPCKSHYKCTDCLEPFDHFKCH